LLCLELWQGGSERVQQHSFPQRGAIDVVYAQLLAATAQRFAIIERLQLLYACSKCK
jgi:hypothetical protein